MIDNTPTPFQQFCRILAAFMLLFIMGTLVFICFYNKPFQTPALSYQLSDGWVDEIGNPVTLNHFYRENADTFHHQKIYYTLPKVEPNQMLLFYCRNMYADVYANDVLLSKDTLVEGTLFGTSPGLRWHMISFAQSDTPVTICIDGYSVYLDSKGLISDVYFGTTKAVFFHAISNHIFTFSISFFLLLISVTLAVMYFFFALRYRIGKDMLYLSAATFFASLWTSSETLLWQLFFGNSELFHLITYLSLIMIPPSFAFIAVCRLKGWAKIYGQVFMMISSANVIIDYLLHFTGVLEFHYTVSVTHVLVVIMLPLLIQLFLSYRSPDAKNKNNPLFLIMVVVLLVGLGITMIRYKMGYFSDFSHSFILSIMCFLGCLIIYHLNMLAMIFKNNAKAKMLRAMALTDHMTGLFNRAAFDEHKSAYVDASSNTATVGVVQFDVNNLKTTNDTLGHEKGDQLIMIISRGLKECFSSKGNCYRMGGDEFLVILTGDDPDVDYNEGIQQFQNYLTKLNACSTLPFALETAHGFVFDEHLSLTQAMNLADERMYENKRELKQL